MNKYQLFLAISFIAVACNNVNNMGENGIVLTTESSEDTLKTYVLNNSIAFDTLSYSNVIESVKYIPLSSDNQSMLGELDMFIKTDKYYILLSEGWGSKMKMKAFDHNGQYVKDVLHVGRGRNEVLSCEHCSYNSEYAQMIACDMDGDKMISIDANDLSVKLYPIPAFCSEAIVDNESVKRYTGGEYFTMWTTVQIAKDLYVGTTGIPGHKIYDENLIPPLCFIDSAFEITEALFYDEPRKIYQEEKEGSNKAIDCWELGNSGKGVFFIDVFNDTIYSVEADKRIKPKYILHRTDEQMPQVTDVKLKNSTVAEKIHFTGLIETDDYILLRTLNGNLKLGTYMWSKNNEAPICIHGNYNVPLSFDGYHGAVDFHTMYATGNTIITTIPAHKLINVLPNLKEDDNLVVVEIKLKDNYVPQTALR